MHRPLIIVQAGSVNIYRLTLPGPLVEGIQYGWEEKVGFSGLQQTEERSTARGTDAYICVPLAINGYSGLQDVQVDSVADAHATRTSTRKPSAKRKSLEKLIVPKEKRQKVERSAKVSNTSLYWVHQLHSCRCFCQKSCVIHTLRLGG